MKSSKLSVLMKKYAVCPDCGSDKLDSESKMLAGLDKFTRICSCGFNIVVDEDDNKIEYII